MHFSPVKCRRAASDQDCVTKIYRQKVRTRRSLLPLRALLALVALYTGACMIALSPSLSARECTCIHRKSSVSYVVKQVGTGTRSPVAADQHWPSAQNKDDSISNVLQVRPLRKPQGSDCRLGSYVVAAQSTADVDFPPYSILNKGSGYDLRFYNVYKVVRMPYERRDEGKAF